MDPMGYIHVYIIYYIYILSTSKADEPAGDTMTTVKAASQWQKPLRSVKLCFLSPLYIYTTKYTLIYINISHHPIYVIICAKDNNHCQGYMRDSW